MAPPENRRRRDTLRKVDRLLEAHFGARDEPTRRDPLDELVRTILSQNTNDVNSHRAYASLRERFPTWDAVMCAQRDTLEGVLRPGGLARTKSGRIQGILKSVAAEHGAPTLARLEDLPDDQVEQMLLGYEGVGYKTARCVLLFALGRDVFPVDTHILRIAIRLGVLPEKTSLDKAHRMLGPAVPKGRSYPLHLNLIALGKRNCRPRNPGCAQCPLKGLCVHAREQR